MRLASLVLVVVLPPLAAIAAAAQPLVALDIGHSLASPGAIGAYGRAELEFNVDLADDIQTLLTSNGHRSILIGRDGSMDHLSRRTSLARRAGATFLLSIHHDSAQPQFLSTWQWQGSEQRYTDQISGYSLFVSRKNPFPAASLRCAHSIGAAMHAAGLHATPHHAAKIAGEFKQWADRDAGVYYYDDLVVLKTATMPTVLLEAGVILNRDDEPELRSIAMRNRIGAAVADGLARCGALTEAGSSTGAPGNIHQSVTPPADGR